MGEIFQVEKVDSSDSTYVGSSDSTYVPVLLRIAWDSITYIHVYTVTIHTCLPLYIARERLYTPMHVCCQWLLGVGLKEYSNEKFLLFPPNSPDHCVGAVAQRMLCACPMNKQNISKMAFLCEVLEHFYMYLWMYVCTCILYVCTCMYITTCTMYVHVH